MGGCCTQRKSDPNSKRSSNITILDNNTNLSFDNFSEDNIKDYFNMAYKEENLLILIQLIKNENKITFEFTTIKSFWFSYPETLGDLSSIKLLTIFQKKINYLLSNEQNISEFSKQEIYDNLINSIKKFNLIKILLLILETDSSTKKDVAIILLNQFSLFDEIRNLMLKEEILQKLIFHINSFRNLKYQKSKEHIIGSLQILRRIYVININLRKTFLECGGFQLLYENIISNDEIIIQEVLYNFEDLIYVDDENINNKSNSKILIKEMIDILIRLNIEKLLMDLFEVKIFNYLIYNYS